MSALKFNVLDVIREPDNYTSSEREKAASAVAEVFSQAQKCASSTGDLAELRTALEKVEVVH